MTSLFVLSILLFAAWVWSVLERDNRAAFMHGWSHVLFVGAATSLFMAIVLAIRLLFR